MCYRSPKCKIFWSTPEQGTFVYCRLAKRFRKKDFKFPLGIDSEGTVIFDKNILENKAVLTSVKQILLKEVDPKYTISDRLYQGHLRRKEEHIRKGNGFGFHYST